jgi:condensin complex subunit 1
MSVTFRSAFSFHLYMLYTYMFLAEAEAKESSNQDATRSGANPSSSASSSPTMFYSQRSVCAETMAQVAKSMSYNRHILWPCGVPEEAVIVLPLRVAFVLLEKAVNVTARKHCATEAALDVIVATLQCTKGASGLSATDSSSETESPLLTHVVTALIDLTFAWEHMPNLVAELCVRVGQHSFSPPPSLVTELLREVGRMDPTVSATNNSTPTGSSAASTGTKNLATFVSELAALRFRWILPSLLTTILPLLNIAENYAVRSALLTAISHIIEQGSSVLTPDEPDNEVLTERKRDLDSKTRDLLLDVLLERAYDINSFTRSAVLKAWIRLTDTGTALPKDRFLPVTQLALNRLGDKTVIVRKQAMQLLTALLENNPFQADLDPTPYRRKLEELHEWVQCHLPENVAQGLQSQPMSELDDTGASIVSGIDEATLAACFAEAELLLSAVVASGELSPHELEFCGKIKAIKFTQSALSFIDLFAGATPALESMLLSSNTSDVTEALRFFVKARHFRLPCAVSGMKRALCLMWSPDQTIKDEIIQTFVEVFIAMPGSNGVETLSDSQIASNLLALTADANYSELASIEEAIKILVLTGKLQSDVFRSLWYTAVNGRCAIKRANSFEILAMGASADRSIVNSISRLKQLLDSSLCDYSRKNEDSLIYCNDWRLVGAAAAVLQKVERAEVDPTDAKYLVLELIIEELCTISVGSACMDNNSADTRSWFSAAERAIKALFVICPSPEIACREILVRMFQSLFQHDDVETVHTLRLTRFFHILGQIALHLLVYSEGLGAAIRRGNAKKSTNEQLAADLAKQTVNKGNDDLEADLGVSAQIEADNEVRLAEISQHEVLGRGLISVFSPLLVEVIKNDKGHLYSDLLMQSAVLAQCRLMCVSGGFCESHLPLLFTALARAPSEDTTMRANTVVALGDLAFRFPNEVEPYTPRIYACLRDRSIRVRRHTLMVLTHLILNDMVKVKGQVCEIALCLRDDDTRIRDMSRLLFHELSKRSNNPVYNLLPDIISQLGQQNLARDDFRGIMSFLLGFITKERQNEMLAEKLCQRFPNCTTIEQKADLAYCLAQLKVTERSLKHLVENFKLYKDALVDDDIKKCLLSLGVKLKKTSKNPELRQMVDGWEARINEESVVGKENEEAHMKASLVKTQSKRRAKIRKPSQLQAVHEEENCGNEIMEETTLVRKISDGDDKFAFEGGGNKDDKENASGNIVSRRSRTQRKQRVRLAD